MRITDVRATMLRLPQVSAAADGTQDDLILRVDTDAGISGWGEVDTAPLVGRAVVDAHMSHGTCFGLRQVLVGRDPFDHEQLWQEMWSKTYYYGRSGPVLHVMSGVDMALWDIMGKATGLPVHKLLGGSHAGQVTAYASALMPETPDEVRSQVERYVAEGFTAVKLGWGPLGSDVRRDAELARAARRAAGDGVEIMIDIGKRYRYKQALTMARACEELGVYWLEEPFPAEDLESYRRLADATSVRIASGEEESGRLAFARLIRETRIDVVQPDLSRCGGLTEARKIATMAADANALCVPHAFKTGIL
ncbi:MAG TPA: mandelate racemase/muconate lactonizing enzyme family protein, partial [Vicinamibacteria bacterium]|nr:mandelate racemase/muconate lactonizing enzyme family protein [Vicinamibacteria bacterium]